MKWGNFCYHFIFLTTVFAHKGAGKDGNYDLKKIKNNKTANEIAEKVGYEGAEDLKEAFVGRDGAKFNMKYDSNTGEIVLESISDSSIQIPTGLYK